MFFSIDMPYGVMIWVVEIGKREKKVVLLDILNESEVLEAIKKRKILNKKKETVNRNPLRNSINMLLIVSKEKGSKSAKFIVQSVLQKVKKVFLLQ